MLPKKKHSRLPVRSDFFTGKESIAERHEEYGSRHVEQRFRGPAKRGRSGGELLEEGALTKFDHGRTVAGMIQGFSDRIKTKK